MHTFNTNDSLVSSMKILKQYEFKTENGLPVFPRGFKSVVFEMPGIDTKVKIARINGKYVEYNNSFGSWRKAYNFNLAEARKELKFFLNDNEYNFVHVVIDN